MRRTVRGPLGSAAVHRYHSAHRAASTVEFTYKVHRGTARAVEMTLVCIGIDFEPVVFAC